MMYEVYLVVKNRLGEYIGKKAIIDQDSYNALVEMAKVFYSTGGFELTCEDDSFVIFPPEIVKESVLIINKKIISEQSEEENKNENVQE